MEFKKTSKYRYLSFYLAIFTLFFAILTLSCGTHPGFKPTEAENSQLKIVGGTSIDASAFQEKADQVTEDDFVYRSTVNFIIGIGHSTGIDILPDSSFCSGTVYNQNWIITAGHCVAGFNQEYLMIKDAYRRTGVTVEPVLLALVGDPSGEYSLRVALQKDMHAHPDYDDSLMDKSLKVSLKATYPLNDIGLVYVSKAFNDWVIGAPILADAFRLFKGEPVLLAGFGANKVKINYFTGEIIASGNSYLRKVLTHLSSGNAKAKEIYVGPDLNKTACSGDSGGPAFIQTNPSEKDSPPQYALLGATSRGNMVCDGRNESVYTDVRKFRDWIETTVKGG